MERDRGELDEKGVPGVALVPGKMGERLDRGRRKTGQNLRQRPKRANPVGVPTMNQPVHEKIIHRPS
jgi:hypothetical protein